MGEFLVSGTGLGYLIIYGGQVFNMTLVMSSIVLLLVVSTVIYYAVDYAERRLLRKRGVTAGLRTPARGGCRRQAGNHRSGSAEIPSRRGGRRRSAAPPLRIRTAARPLRSESRANRAPGAFGPGLAARARRRNRTAGEGPSEVHVARRRAWPGPFPSSGLRI